MILIGILGGIGSGKSLVASELARLGAVILDGDRMGHLVLEEVEVRNAMRERWGEAIFREDGSVNRPEIAKRVFGDAAGAKEELHFLEKLTHPRIGQRLFEELDRLKQAGAVRLAVLDAPVMTKTGWHKQCDRLWFIECPKGERIRRVAARGWSASQLEAYEAAQDSLEWRKSLCDTVIDNSGNQEATRAQVEEEARRLLTEVG
jgi:dephospho-CoA kinase